MSSALRIRLSYFMLLCFLTAIVPFGTPHKHDGSSECDESDPVLEHDACHISIYHGELQANHCEHESHFTEESEDCAFCHLRSINHYKFKPNTGNDLIDLVYSATEPIYEVAFKTSELNRNSSSRAPPAC